MTRTEALTKFFQVTPKTLIRWEASGVELKSPESIARYIVNMQRPAPGVIEQIRIGDLEARLEKAMAGVTDEVELPLKDQKLAKEVELLDLKVQQQRGELVSRAEIREVGQRVGALIVAELAALANDAPGQLAGADEATIRERLEARHVVFVNRLREAVGQIETVGMEA